MRTFYHTSIGIRARLQARLKPIPTPTGIPPVFIIGCGRSGTTLLGDILDAYPKVRYICEPYDLWAAVHPVADFLQLYSRGEHHCLLAANSATSAAKKRFQRLMSSPPGFTLVEKSPINTLRIGFLDALAPGARFVHIVRDGVNVAYSIEQKASSERSFAFRPPLNNWWGMNNAKWAALKLDGIAAGYYPDEVSQLTTDAQRGAYEWLVSMREINIWRERLETRFIELRLDDLISDPRNTLKYVIDGLGLSLPDEEWLDQAVRKVRPVTNNYDKELVLPGKILADFNRLQEIYDFKGRATSGSLARVSGIPGSAQ